MIILELASIAAFWTLAIIGGLILLYLAALMAGAGARRGWTLLDRPARMHRERGDHGHSRPTRHAAPPDRPAPGAHPVRGRAPRS